MKKILSMLLSITMLTSVCCMKVSAAEETTSLQRQKLGALLDAYSSPPLWGRPVLYWEYAESYSTAKEIYETDNLSETEYLMASDDLLNDILNMYVVRGYAEAVYETTGNDQNYNNWYSDDDWANYQSSVEELKNAIDSLEDNTVYSKRLTKAFHGVLKAYNEMTNKHTLKGDINGDGEVNVSDVTLLQKYLVGTAQLTGAQKMLAGAVEYENPSITEATTIQKYCAGLMTELPNNNIFIDDLGRYTDRDLLMERTINFNICPRTCVGTGSKSRMQNGYSGINYMDYYYKWCYENNVEP